MRTGPDYIQFYPTLRCNQSCDFCFNRGLSSLPDMSSQRFTTFLDTITKLSVKTLDVIGGEPTLHPNIVPFVREACQQGLQVNISSNGSNVKALEDIHRAGDRVTIGISINERDTLDHLKRFIQQRKPVVKTVYSKTMDLVLMTDILMLHPKKFYLIYRDVLDQAELHAAAPFHWFMSPAQQSLYAASNIGTVFCSGFLPDQQYPELATVRCPAGTTKLGIMPDGSVYPCNLFFGRKEFLLGNILDDPFESIWNHHVLGFFRSFKRNQCPRTSCELHAQCHGGCPAHAFALTGDISTPDPRCA